MTPLLVGNWKMNVGPQRSVELASAFAKAAAAVKQSRVWIAPSYPALLPVVQAVRGSPIKVGAQNVAAQASGAYTGEVSVAMLKESGCSFALAGHSERRQHFAESDQLVAQRTLGALSQEFTVILCIGETLAEREQGHTVAVCTRQLEPVLAGLQPTQAPRLVLAYEPVWAIGTGKVASPSDIGETVGAIIDLWSSRTAIPCPPVLYGGSVDPDNFAAILKVPGVAGGLVGGASIHHEKFPALISIAERHA